MRDEADKLLSTAEVATHLGVTRQRVLELITDQRLAAIKVGRSYVVRAGDVASLELLKAGRPPKAKTNGTPKDPTETTAKLNKATRSAKEAEEAGKVTKAEKGVLRSEAPKQMRTKKVGKV